MQIIHFLLLIIILNFHLFEILSLDYFHNEWVVQIPGGAHVAEFIAADLGYVFRGKIKGFHDKYLFTQNLQSNHEKRGFHKLTRELHEDHRILWVERQEIKSRQKRDFVHNEIIEDTPTQLKNKHFLRVKRNGYMNPERSLFNDELWSQEWYLQDTRTRTDLPKLDLNVLPVYRAGITGKGVRVTILDDGIEYTHDDLNNNYDSEISWDCNEDDSDPLPRYDNEHRNSHGTRCAGEVAMVADNGKCGVGIAYNARIGGVKMLDGFVNDRIEGTALGFAYKLVDIYSASWGPNDDGKTVDGPGTLAREALERGVNKGRNGLGSIYVWASGNGGGKGDNCNCDGYIASPYTIAIGSASQRGSFPWYGEQCSATVAVTYSSGAYLDQMIATTDLDNKCTIKHTGTSASAPLAAGIIALALEANPHLSWRDVQHLIIWTSELAPIADNPGWQKNAGGLWFNNRFGFGLMNAHALVSAAANWTRVPERLSCTIPAQRNNILLKQGQIISIEFETIDCNINYLEHVEVKTNINYSTRGDLEMFLNSAEGTKVQILSPRKFDTSKDGFKNWSFMSVMTWSENPIGIWRLEITDKNKLRNNSGNVGESWLTIHGTKSIPFHMINGKRVYNENYNRVHKKMQSYYEEMEKFNELFQNSLKKNHFIGYKK